MIFSCVRAPEAGTATGLNTNRGVGFVDDWRRLNVAITRAKYAMWIVGHAGVLKQSAEWRELINDSRRRGAYISETPTEGHASATADEAAGSTFNQVVTFTMRNAGGSTGGGRRKGYSSIVDNSTPAPAQHKRGRAHGQQSAGPVLKYGRGPPRAGYMPPRHPTTYISSAGNYTWRPPPPPGVNERNPQVLQTVGSSPRPLPPPMGNAQFVPPPGQDSNCASLPQQGAGPKGGGGGNARFSYSHAYGRGWPRGPVMHHHSQYHGAPRPHLQ